MKSLTKLQALAEGSKDASPKELDKREQLIDRIEGFFGDLQSVPYSQVSTADLRKIYNALLDKQLIQPIRGAKVAKGIQEGEQKPSGNQYPPELTLKQQEKIIDEVIYKLDDEARRASHHPSSDAELDYECRLKSVEVFRDTKTVEWVTQESSEAESKDGARVIAKAFRKAGVRGWTVKVTVRDNWRAPNTKWHAIAKS